MVMKRGQYINSIILCLYVCHTFILAVHTVCTHRSSSCSRYWSLILLPWQGMSNIVVLCWMIGTEMFDFSLSSLETMPSNILFDVKLWNNLLNPFHPRKPLHFGTWYALSCYEKATYVNMLMLLIPVMLAQCLLACIFGARLYLWKSNRTCSMFTKHDTIFLQQLFHDSSCTTPSFCTWCFNTYM